MQSGYARWFAVSAILCLSAAAAGLFQTVNAMPADADVAASGDAAQSNALMSELSNTGTSAVDTVRQTGKSMEEVVRAGGRTTLALGSLIGQLLNFLSATVATGTGYVASGVSSVDGYANSWPVVGVLTGGANNLVSGVSSAINDMSANGRETRQKMFAKFREQLDSSAGTSVTGVEVTESTE